MEGEKTYQLEQQRRRLRCMVLTRGQQGRAGGGGAGVGTTTGGQQERVSSFFSFGLAACIVLWNGWVGESEGDIGRKHNVWLRTDGCGDRQQTYTQEEREVVEQS